MVQISEEVNMQERRWRKKLVELGQPGELEKSDREGQGISKPCTRKHAESSQYQHRQGWLRHKTDGGAD